MLAGCPLCQVLYPERQGQCETCGGRVSMVEARMMSRELIRDRVRQGVQDYLQTPEHTALRRTALNALLATLHTYAPSAATYLNGAGIDLERLRKDHETLPQV